MLENATKKIMIIGYEAISKEAKNKRYNYLGCLYPEGVIASDKNLLFNHEQIKDIYYIGYNDEDCKIFNKTLQEMIKKIDSGEISLEETETNPQ